MSHVERNRAILWGGLIAESLDLTAAVLCGLLYGIAVYAFMNVIVLPLSAVAFKPSHTPAALAQGLVIHMLCVGLPIALAVRRAK